MDISKKSIQEIDAMLSSSLPVESKRAADNTVAAPPSNVTPLMKIEASINAVTSEISSQLDELSLTLDNVLGVPIEPTTDPDSIPVDGSSRLISRLSSHRYDLVIILGQLRELNHRAEV